MKVYSQLVSAQFENKASDYSAGTIGRIWINTSSSLAKFDDGSAIRTFVTTDNTQTLTNKTLSGNIAVTLVSGAATVTLPTTTGTLATLANAETLTNKKLVDASTTIIDDSDATKILALQCSGITTGTTRTWTVIDRSGSVVVSGTPTTTKGDILVDTGTSLARLAIGTNAHVLTADSGEASGVKWAAATAAPTSSLEISNLGFTSSVAASALTLTLTQFDGSSPSAGTPTKIGFRSSTTTLGQYAQQTLTSATAGATLTVPSTATLGFAGGSATNYLYVYAIDNAGTIEIAVAGVILDEGSLQSSTILDTSSDSIATLYSTTARASKAVRLLGRIKFTLATAGTWNEAGDELTLMPFETQHVHALYETNVAQAMASGAATLVDFEDKVLDSHNAVTTGGSWKFTAPIAGIYRVTAMAFGSNTAGWATTESWQLILYKNGAAERTMGVEVKESSTNQSCTSGSTLVSLAAGGYVHVVVYHDNGSSINLGGAATTNWVSIERVGMA